MTFDSLLDETFRLLASILETLDQGKTVNLAGGFGGDEGSVSYKFSITDLSASATNLGAPIDELGRGNTERKPLVDVIERGKKLIVLALLPGVRKEDVEARFSKGSIIIDVNRGGEARRWTVPCKSRARLVSVNCKNGVLELIFTRQEKKR